MNETAASSNACKGETAAQLITRLSLQCRGNPIIVDLARINEAIEADCLASALRASKHPELKGIGKSFELGGSSETGLMDRAKGLPNNSNDTVQRVALHAAIDPEEVCAGDRAEVAKNRSLPTADDIIALVDGTFSRNETVQPLSVKDSENNGCTEGSLSPPISTPRFASEDNSFASPLPARSAHEGNEPCTAPAPPSPVQKLKGELEADVGEPDRTPTEAPLATFSLGYCRCDFFDNGAPPEKAVPKSGRSRARFRVNAFLGPDRHNYTLFKIALLSEPRFFDRSVPDGHSAFYAKVWARFEELRRAVRVDSIPMDIEPAIGHIKNKKNHVVPRAAAILFKTEGAPAEVFLFLDGSVFAIRLDRPAKGSAKCAALKAIGYWNPE